MQIVKFLFSFQGRVSRQHFWMGNLGMLVALLALSTIAAALNAGADVHDSYDFIIVVSMLPYIWASQYFPIQK